MTPIKIQRNQSFPAHVFVVPAVSSNNADHILLVLSFDGIPLRDIIYDTLFRVFWQAIYGYIFHFTKISNLYHAKITKQSQFCSPCLR